MTPVDPEMTAHDQVNPVAGVGAASKPADAADLVAEFLEGTVSAGASSQEVAEVIAQTFQRIADALVPVIGQRGMAALYQRSLHLSGPAFSLLVATTEAVATVMNTAPLEAELAKQTAADAAKAGSELLKVFHVLLTTLIGQSLTERLLRAVWAHFLSGPSARYTLP
jgi:hypothetical protein